MYGMRVLRVVCVAGGAPWGNEGGQGGGVDDAHDFVLVRVEPEQAQPRQKVHEEHGHHVRPHRDALGLESPHRLVRARRHRPKNNPVAIRMSSDTTRATTQHDTKGKKRDLFSSLRSLMSSIVCATAPVSFMSRKKMRSAQPANSSKTSSSVGIWNSRAARREERKKKHNRNNK
jgi:hypothetical protein